MDDSQNNKIPQGQVPTTPSQGQTPVVPQSPVADQSSILPPLPSTTPPSQPSVSPLTSVTGISLAEDSTGTEQGQSHSAIKSPVASSIPAQQVPTQGAPQTSTGGLLPVQSSGVAGVPQQVSVEKVSTGIVSPSESPLPQGPATVVREPASEVGSLTDQPLGSLATPATPAPNPKPVVLPPVPLPLPVATPPTSSTSVPATQQPIEGQTTVESGGSSPFNSNPPTGGGLAGVMQASESVTKGTPPPAQQAQEVMPTVPPKSKLNIKKLLIGIVGVMLLIVLGLGLFAYIKNARESDLGEIEGEVVWWGLEDESVYSDLIKEYESKNSNTKITYKEQSPENYRERLTNSIAKGEGPDIYEYHNTWVPMFATDLDTLPSEIMTEAEYVQTFYPVIVSDMATVDGIVGIPLMYDAITLFVNEDLLAVAVASPPTTWDELLSLSKTLTQRGEQDIIILSGVALGNSSNVEHWQEIISLMMLQNGVVMSNPQGPLAEDVLQYFAQFESSEKIWNETLPGSVTAFGNGDVAMIFAPISRIPEILKSNPNIRFSTVPVPQLRKENPSEPDVSYSTYWTEGVWSGSERRALSWDFLKFMSNANSQQKIFNKRQELNGVGLLPPRVDLALTYKDSPYLGSVAALAPEAKSWYLASRTNDGASGINSQLAKAYSKAINSASGSRANIEGITAQLATDVNQILAQYGLVKLIIIPEK